MRLNYEEGWGPYSLCIRCESARQIDGGISYTIIAQQVRNCATSLNLWPGKYVRSEDRSSAIEYIKLDSNLTLPYSVSN